jgi:hypothetical protein
VRFCDFSLERDKAKALFTQEGKLAAGMDKQHRRDAAQAIGLLRGDWAIFLLQSGPKTQRPVTDSKLGKGMRFSVSLVEFLRSFFFGTR